MLPGKWGISWKQTKQHFFQGGGYPLRMARQKGPPKHLQKTLVLKVTLYTTL